MKKSTLVLIIVASSLVALGAITFCVGMGMAKFNFGAFGTKLEINTHEVSDSFDSINVVTDVNDVVFLPSSDGRCVVECGEESKVLHEVSVVDGELRITRTDLRKWYDHISFFTVGEHYIKVYLPKSEYKNIKVKASTADVELSNSFSAESIEIYVSTGDVECHASATGLVKIRATTGDVELEGLSAGSIDISVSTGMVELESVSCGANVALKVTTGDSSFQNVKLGDLTSGGTTGDIYLKGVIASGKIDIVRDTGDVTFERSDAEEIKVKTDTGKVQGTLLSTKIFYTKTDTGRVNVPKSTSGGICDIQTDTGRIEISVVS